MHDKVLFTLDSFSVDGNPGMPEGVTQDDWDNDTLYVAVMKSSEEKTGGPHTSHIHQYYWQVHGMRREGVEIS